GYLSARVKSAPKGCWYDVIENALPSLSMTKNDWDFDPDYTPAEAASFVMETAQEDMIPADKADENQAQDLAPLPDWVLTHMAVEQHPPKTLMPSKMDEEDVPVRSPLMGKNDQNRFQRGLLTHSLLQYLPDIAPGMRSTAAENFMTRQAPDLSPTLQKSITDECLSILNNDQFASFFGENSLAEVPVTGVIQNKSTGKSDIISGQIDRMLITETDIWIVDYKSNRPPPRDPNKIPTQYKSQMKAYRALISDIYPTHKIHTALLWTDGPFMMEIDA
ncbi:MAG: double-strand break repair helicase AddA, partial [Alphaproteobacteria bacterium]